MERHRLENITPWDNGYTATIVMTPETGTAPHWFDGHFPGAPILPAIAQIAMAGDLLNETTDGFYSITSLKKVRFKRMIRPGERLFVEIDLKTGGEVFFRVSVQGETACTGTLEAAFVETEPVKPVA